MNRFLIFVVRAILSAFFAVLLTRFFYPDAHWVFTVGLGIFLLGMAHVTEYLRKRKTG